MADPNSPPPSLSEVMAGLDYNAAPKLSDMADPRTQTVLDTAKAFQRQELWSEGSATQFLKDTWGTSTFTGSLLEAYQLSQGKDLTPDPTFTSERLRERLKEVEGILDPSHLTPLAGAVSDTHFDVLVEFQKRQMETAQRLEEYGFTGTAALFLTGIFDPVGALIAAPIAAPFFRVGTMLGKTALTKNLIGGAAAGGAGNVAVEAAIAATGKPTSPEDLAMAAGYGIFLGGLFGAGAGAIAGRSPELRQFGQAAKKMAETAEKAKQATLKALGKPDTVSKGATPVDPEVARPAPPEAPQQALIGEILPPERQLPPPEADVTIDDVAAATGVDPGTIRGVKGIVDEVTDNLGLPRVTPEDAPAAKRTVADLEQFRVELSDLERKNSRLLAKYVAPTGDEARISAMSDDMSGPYQVVFYADGKPQRTLKGLESLDDAKQAIFTEVADRMGPEAVLAQAAQAAQAGPSAQAAGGAGGGGTIPPSAGAQGVPSAPRPEGDLDMIARALAANPHSVPYGGVSMPLVGNLLNWTRMDWAATGTMSKLPFVRMMAPHLLTETVGMRGHEATAMSSIQRQKMLFDKYATRYDRTLIPALDEYTADMGYKWNQIPEARQQFFNQVDAYVRGVDPGTVPYHKAVVRVGNEIKSIHAEMLQYLKNPFHGRGVPPGRPIPGAEQTDYNLNYMSRVFDDHKVLAIWAKHQSDTITVAMPDGTMPKVKVIEELHYQAIRSAQPELTPKQARALAQAYSLNVYKRAARFDDTWDVMMAQGRREALAKTIKETTDGVLTDADIRNLLDRIMPYKAEVGMTNLKPRVLLDETASLTFTGNDGQTHTIRYRDFLDTDANRVFLTYLRRATGRIAAAQIRVPDELNGGFLIDGITTDGEMARIVQAARVNAVEQLGPNEELWYKDIDALLFGYARTIGMPVKGYTKGQPEYSDHGKNWARWLQRVKEIQTMRLMGQVGFAQLGEMGTPVAHLGMRAALQQIPAYRRVLDIATGKQKLTDEFLDEIESLGVGGSLHQISWFPRDEIGDGFFDIHRSHNPTLDTVDNALRTGRNAVYQYSGMFAVQRYQQLHTAAMFAQKVANLDPKKLSKFDKRQLAYFDIDEAMLGRVLDQLDKHSKLVESTFFNRKVKSLRLDSWDDLGARAALEEALFRASNKYIQTSDPSSVAWFMNSAIGQAVFQFRSFALTAWANQLQHTMHMGLVPSLQSFVWGVMWNAAVRAAQVQLLSIGRGDRERYLAKNMEPMALAKAGFQRSGWSSILPTVADTMWFGKEAIFDARSTGQPTNLILGSPAATFFDQMKRGGKGLVRSMTGGSEMSRSEARALLGLLPFQNLHGISQMLDYMVSGQPDRARR